MKSKYAIIISAAAVSITASAQISREIVVEREVVPIELPASRISLMPTTVKTQFPAAKVKFSDAVVAAEITPLRTVLEPALTDEADSAAINQRGYIDLGYFPAFNLGVSAGYQFVNNEKSTLGAWLQYNGHSYKGNDRWDAYKYHIKRNTFTLGAEGTHRLNATSGLHAALSYTYDANKWETPIPDGSRIEYNNRPTLNAHILGLTAGYYGKSGLWGYCAAFNGGVNSLSSLQNFDPKISNSEWLYGINGELNYTTGDDSRAGLRVDWQMRSFSFSDHAAEGKTLGVVKLNPYWASPLLEGMNIELGVNADFSVNSGTTANFSPECAISWSPRGTMSIFAVEVKATGGLHANTLASLLDYTPYINPAYDEFTDTYRTLGNSHIPYDLAAAVTIGPFSGAYLELSGEFAKANDWMMPMCAGSCNTWSATDVKGWLLGAKAGYRFRNLGEISVAYQHASNDGDKAFYRWRDRAKQALDARLTITPVKPLEVSVGYEARWGRKVIASYGDTMTEFWLGAKRNLWLGASYRVTPRFTIFARGENLLNSHYEHVFDVPAQGLTGLVGAQYTF
ncbi:MAG: autotransporter outer membrane beta-barrel domain-containing protein [Muribaculaceae bacterium]|nr:autotransporter outer membrane beta-barrel domain-containing protein [Muribaculaceae bacterium]